MSSGDGRMMVILVETLGEGLILGLGLIRCIIGWMGKMGLLNSLGINGLRLVRDVGWLGKSLSS